jgi:hypothetical protein
MQASGSASRPVEGILAGASAFYRPAVRVALDHLRGITQTITIERARRIERAKMLEKLGKPQLWALWEGRTLAGSAGSNNGAVLDAAIRDSHCHADDAMERFHAEWRSLVLLDADLRAQDETNFGYAGPKVKVTEVSAQGGSWEWVDWLLANPPPPSNSSDSGLVSMERIFGPITLSPDGAPDIPLAPTVLFDRFYIFGADFGDELDMLVFPTWYPRGDTVFVPNDSSSVLLEQAVTAFTPMPGPVPLVELCIQGETVVYVSEGEFVALASGILPLLSLLANTQPIARDKDVIDLAAQELRIARSTHLVELTGSSMIAAAAIGATIDTESGRAALMTMCYAVLLPKIEDEMDPEGRFWHCGSALHHLLGVIAHLGRQHPEIFLEVAPYAAYAELSNPLTHGISKAVDEEYLASTKRIITLSLFRLVRLLDWAHTSWKSIAELERARLDACGESPENVAYQRLKAGAECFSIVITHLKGSLALCHRPSNISSSALAEDQTLMPSQSSLAFISDTALAGIEHSLFAITTHTPAKLAVAEIEALNLASKRLNASAFIDAPVRDPFEIFSNPLISRPLIDRNRYLAVEAERQRAAAESQLAAEQAARIARELEVSQEQTVAPSVSVAPPPVCVPLSVVTNSDAPVSAAASITGPSLGTLPNLLIPPPIITEVAPVPVPSLPTGMDNRHVCPMDAPPPRWNGKIAPSTATVPSFIEVRADADTASIVMQHLSKLGIEDDQKICSHCRAVNHIVMPYCELCNHTFQD